MEKQKKFEKIFKEHLKVETYSKSIESLYSPRLKLKINYKPYYQRNYVWDDTKATYFIESILLGTEIPPLIFFDNNDEIEIIDGRQRFETILRFMDNQFNLKKRGLQQLTLLKGQTWDSLAKKEKEIIDNFLEAKLRIIEFKLVNEPPLDKVLEDQVKKEIFSRYNSGITPLRRDEIENAVYDDDELSNSFKDLLRNDQNIGKDIYTTFFKPTKKNEYDLPEAKILSFIRRSLVLPQFPINLFTQGTGRTDIFSRLYEVLADSNIDNQEEVIKMFIEKVRFLKAVKEYSLNQGLAMNRLAIDCFLWGFGVMDLEEVNYELSHDLKVKICNFVDQNIDEYTEVDYSFTAETTARYYATAMFFQTNFQIDLDIYLEADKQTRTNLRKGRENGSGSTKLNELESLRISKPEPSRNSIDDISRMLMKRRFLIRPSYQRREVINPAKASAIIESILLDITLPAIFIYKKANNTYEVIDGQQRLLTILGFIGNEYMNERGINVFSKNHNFKLRKLRILSELNGKGFIDLNENQRDKILDFQLYIVEIDENQNPKFEPVDLFIRLNDKPYPIRENSFEMWNSWADVEVIDKVKRLREELSPWFYQKLISKPSDRDRMENEELLMSLVFLDYYLLKDSKVKVLDTYQKTDRINSRISTKAKISALMQSITEEKSVKKDFEKSIKNIKSFARNLKYILLDKDTPSEELPIYLSAELDEIIKGGKETRYFRRTIQDFYFLWMFIGPLNFEMVKFYRTQMKKEIKDAFRYFKNIPVEHQDDNLGYLHFEKILNQFHEKYKKNIRRTKLSESQKKELINKQNGLSSLSSAPVFLGDDIEVDHIKPISIGGEDKIENLGIAHMQENRGKGAKY